MPGRANPLDPDPTRAGDRGGRANEAAGNVNHPAYDAGGHRTDESRTDEVLSSTARLSVPGSPTVKCGSRPGARCRAGPTKQRGPKRRARTPAPSPTETRA